MKGLVLAGGTGTRLRPLTDTRAKQLLPVANRPILFYVLDNLASAGIHDIGIVVAQETGAEVRAVVGDGSRWGSETRITYISQDRPRGLAHAVRIAKDFLGEDDFCVFLGDNLIGTKIREAWQTFSSSPGFRASVMLKEVSDPSRFGVAEVDGAGHVTKLVEKPKSPQSSLALVGIYMFRSAIFDAIDQIVPSPRGELEITDALSKLIELGGTVHFERVTSWWFDAGDKESLLEANSTILEASLEHEVLGSVGEECSLEGRLNIGAGTNIVRSSLRGPVIIGRNVRIVDSQIGPNTSLGDGVVVERSSIRQSVIMEETHIKDAHLEDALIGRRVVVEARVASGARALMIGDGVVSTK